MFSTDFSGGLHDFVFFRGRNASKQGLAILTPKCEVNMSMPRCLPKKKFLEIAPCVVEASRAETFQLACVSHEVPDHEKTVVFELSARSQQLVSPFGRQSINQSINPQLSQALNHVINDSLAHLVGNGGGPMGW